MTNGILIVEKDHKIAAELKNCLEDLDYHILDVVDDVEEAVDVAAEKCPILTIINISMEGKMTSVEASKLIMQLNLPVFLLTDDLRYSNLFKNSSAYGFINKNFDKNVLKHQISHAISRFAIENEKINLAHGFVK